MRFMNEFDILQAERRWGQHRILGPAIETLKNLVDWTNSNSDGWAYWPKPCRAAAKLQELITGDGTNRVYSDFTREDVTVEAYKKALAPIKSFRTKHSADFDIVAAR